MQASTLQPLTYRYAWSRSVLPRHLGDLPQWSITPVGVLWSGRDRGRRYNVTLFEVCNDVDIVDRAAIWSLNRVRQPRNEVHLSNTALSKKRHAELSAPRIRVRRLHSLRNVLAQADLDSDISTMFAESRADHRLENFGSSL